MERCKQIQEDGKQDGNKKGRVPFLFRGGRAGRGEVTCNVSGEICHLFSHSHCPWTGIP